MKRHNSRFKLHANDSEDPNQNNEAMLKLLFRALISWVAFILFYLEFCMPRVRSYGSMQELYLSDVWFLCWLFILTYFYPLSCKIKKLAQKANHKIIAFFSEYFSFVMMAYLVIAVFISLFTLFS